MLQLNLEEVHGKWLEIHRKKVHIYLQINIGVDINLKCFVVIALSQNGYCLKDKQK